ncbi:MAG: hypothetical protein ABI675_15090 [Chitinophagaceae bacterium]
MANKANSYSKKAHKMELMRILKGEADGTGQLGASALLGIKDLVLVVLGGGVIAAVSGKVALPVGFIITGTGYYTNNKILQLLGAGTMAANGFQKTGTVQGLDGLDGVKERLQAYKESLKEKFFIDKLLKKKETTTSGIGEVQYFNYGDGMNGDLAALDEIENQLAESALQFQGTMAGEPDYVIGEMEEMNY